MNGRLAFTAALVALALAGPEARAQTDPEGDVQRHFDRGVALGEEGRWTEAVAAFERARERAPLPAVLFNLAEARRHAGRLCAAREAYREYLLRATPSANYRAAAVEQIAALEPRLARLRVEVDPASARVQVDAVELTEREIDLDPGPHAIVIRAELYEADARTVLLAEAEHTTLAVRLRELPGPPPVSAPPTPPPAAAPVDPSYRDAFQLGVVAHVIGDDGSVGFGLGLRLGLRVSSAVELFGEFGRATSNDVPFTTGGIGALYLWPLGPRLLLLAGAQLGVIVPTCTARCTQASNGRGAQTDLAIAFSLQMRLEVFRWMAIMVEGNVGVARLTEIWGDPVPIINATPGLIFSLPM